jgi:glycosyltransferase involved in cell wall biosynthesis
MDALDVVVLTSLHEGLPRVLPEAMAGGCPVVATAVDGTPEAVTDGETGYLVAPRDVDGLTRHVVALLQEPGRAQALGEAGRSRVSEFDINLMVQRQEQLYRGLMERSTKEAA